MYLCLLTGALAFCLQSFAFFQFVSQPNSTMEASEVGPLIQSLQGVAAEMDKDTISQVHRACGVIEKMALQQCRDVVNRSGS